jgi:hypothetical protein
VLADAIALGCTPITYPLGALPENFDGYCQWVKFPTGANPEAMQREPVSQDPLGLFKSEEAIQNVIAAVAHLEQNPELKNKVKTDGARFITSKLHPNRVGQMWLNFIAQLIPGG